MPYIVTEQRKLLNDDIDKLVKSMNALGDDARRGIFNYVITKLALGVIGVETRYSKINDVVGAMECCKLELYRRLAANYEDDAVRRNGDVYK